MKESLTALLIDDDHAQAYLMGRILGQIEAMEIELVHYSCTRSAMADLLTARADLVFLDHHLGEGQTGLELLRSMRDNGFEDPIVMLTGRTDEELVESFLRFGADAYIDKAELDPERLGEAIRVALQSPHKAVPRVLTERNTRR